MSSIQTNAQVNPERTGLEDVLRSARQLARETRGLAESTAGVVERELAMATSYVFGVDLVENFVDKPRPQLDLLRN